MDGAYEVCQCTPQAASVWSIPFRVPESRIDCLNLIFGLLLGRAQAMRKEEVLDDESLVKDSAKEEIRMLTSLQSSRHVIRLLGTFESTTHVYMAMEWAPCDFFQLMTDHFASHRCVANI